MTFPLAGLLRVRGAQERVAAEQLAHASAERAQAEAATRNAVASLSELSPVIRDGHTLMAMAAARAAGRSALGDLQALAELTRDSESVAKSAHVDARRELKGLERLENTHRLDTATAELAAEQVALDEIAVARSARGEGSAA
ncbi:flagellar FliJ family protein [Microbacterium sp. 3J1]|uniref:flagellar FliJ family protein n=1 Tax=Microbacterium sp. 3J1 TaxID=861269 RepID=UPI000B11EB2C|nr:flagellar FliJ family protein [Microbacterium sp. 3J1]